MKIVENAESWGFVCPRCHSVQGMSKDAVKKEKTFERTNQRRTKAEEEFRRSEKKKTVVVVER